ncbi:MAG TPA: peptidase M28, partial [Aequorivita sp.]|nr:peptidase M28 [Aequorivita sp.]
MKSFVSFIIVCFTFSCFSQTDQRIYDIINAVSSERIKADITTLANFGTRNTFSDTISNTRGIGAARRWIKGEFEAISKDCNNCL